MELKIHARLRILNLLVAIVVYSGFGSFIYIFLLKAGVSILSSPAVVFFLILAGIVIGFFLIVDIIRGSERLELLDDTIHFHSLISHKQISLGEVVDINYNWWIPMSWRQPVEGGVGLPTKRALIFVRRDGSQVEWRGFALMLRADMDQFTDGIKQVLRERGIFPFESDKQHQEFEQMVKEAGGSRVGTMISLARKLRREKPMK